MHKGIKGGTFPLYVVKNPDDQVPVGTHLCEQNGAVAVQPKAPVLGDTPLAGSGGLQTHAAQVLVPVEPHLGVLVSMAVCLDHGFGLLAADRQESRLHDMRKLYDEVVGRGYYRPDNEGYYQGFLKPEGAGPTMPGNWPITYD